MKGMARPENELGTARPTVIRNRANYFSGWFIALGLLALSVATDAMHLYSRWNDAPDETPLQALPLYLAYMAIGLGAFAVFSRPRMEVAFDAVVLRNVFRDIQIPPGSIDDLDDSGKYLVITAGGQRYTAAATEASNFTMFLGRQGSARATAGAITASSGAADGGEGIVHVTLRGWPRGGELALWTAYVAYPAAAILHQALS